MKTRDDLLWAVFGEAGLLLVPAALGWAVHEPLIFASLGPTAYELVEQPQIRSAKPYNIIVGHLIALGSAYLSLYVLNAWSSPSVMSAGIVSTKRLGAAVIAASLTTLITLILRASQPAALATTLLISLGAMQTLRDAATIVAGVLIVVLIGEPIRRFRLKYTETRPVLSSPSRT